MIRNTFEQALNLFIKSSGFFMAQRNVQSFQIQSLKSNSSLHYDKIDASSCIVFKHPYLVNRKHYLRSFGKPFSLIFCSSFSGKCEKRERKDVQSLRESSSDRTEVEKLTVPSSIPQQRRESFLYKSDSEGEVSPRCLSPRHHSFSEGQANISLFFNIFLFQLPAFD